MILETIEKFRQINSIKKVKDNLGPNSYVIRDSFECNAGK